MKNLKKILAVVLTLCMMCSMFVMFGTSASAETVQTKWENNSGAIIPAQDACQSLFSKTNSFFSYGIYVRANDTTVADRWNSTDAKTDANLWGIDDNGTIYDGYKYTCWPSHNLGVKFTAPYTGTVMIKYQLGAGNVTNASLIVGKDDLQIDSTGGAYNQMKEISIVGTDFTQQATMTIDVEAEQNYYFIVRNLSDYKKCFFWINSLEYVDVTTAEVLGHQIAALETPVVNYFVQHDAELTSANSTATVGGETVDVEVKAAIGEYDGKTFTADDHVYIYSVPVSARKMSETVTLSIKNIAGTVLATDNYSVAEYCNSQIAAYNADKTNDEQHAVARACTGILMYGKTMQQYFGNVENLPVLDEALLNEVVAYLKAN